jgi:hypothetical protein
MTPDELIQAADPILRDQNWTAAVVMAAIVTERALRNREIDCDPLWRAIKGAPL